MQVTVEHAIQNTDRAVLFEELLEVDTAEIHSRLIQHLIENTLQVIPLLTNNVQFQLAFRHFAQNTIVDVERIPSWLRLIEKLVLQLPTLAKVIQRCLFEIRFILPLNHFQFLKTVYLLNYLVWFINSQQFLRIYVAILDLRLIEITERNYHDSFRKLVKNLERVDELPF